MSPGESSPDARDLDVELAASLDAEPALLPFLPELLADVDVLGSSPAAVLELARGLELAGRPVLDLGCGKGGLALPLAAELGARVVGVDLFPPFVAEAGRRAERLGVAGHARFRCGDLREALDEEAYDLVVYASVGVLGRLDDAVGLLRRAVRPGGHLIVDDAFLVGDGPPAPGYEDFASLEATRARLAAHGDELVREVLASPAEQRAENARTTELIRARAEALAARHPEHASLFRAYVARQEAECEILDERCGGATWLVRRSS